MKCPRCGRDNPASVRFCVDCGTVLPPSETTLGYPDSPLRFSPKQLLSCPGIGDKYEILEELGRGGMGVVYKARDTKLKRLVALKFLSPLLAGGEVHMRRFIQEAQTASALNHPNICTIYEVGESEGTAFIAMEYIEGKALNALITPPGLPMDEVLRYGLQIAAALRHAHRRQVIHRDLKTANVMITPEGQAKVLDFGLAKRLGPDDLQEATLSRVTLTEPGSVVGTLHALAPEVLRGQPADARSDIWALGIILFEMAAGKPPFAGKTGFALTSSILRDDLPPLPARVPEFLRSVIERCLAKDPEARYQEAGEVMADLETAASLQAEGPRRDETKSRRRLWPWLLAGGAAVAGLVLLATMIGRGPKPIAPVKDYPKVSTGARASSRAEANEYFEKAMLFLLPQFDLARARDMLSRALEFDPKFAEARAWYGFTFILEIDSGQSNDTESLYRAEEELRRALADDPRSARVHSGLAALYLYQGRKELIPGEVAKALQANPGELDAKNWLANYYASNGEDASAKEVLGEELKANPLFFAARMNLADILRSEGDTRGAIIELNKILEQSPQNPYALHRLARAFLDAGDLKAARLRLESLTPADQKGYEARLTWALLLALEGKKAEARRKADADTLKYAALAFYSISEAAEFYALLGESTQALDWLERAARNGDERDAWFQRDPLLASVRALPKFQQIIQSIVSRRQREGGRTDKPRGS